MQWGSFKKTYTPRTTDQARQPPSGNVERGTASEVVGLKSTSFASIEVSRSTRSLSFSCDIISCDTHERVSHYKGQEAHHISLFSQRVSKISDINWLRLCRNIKLGRKSSSQVEGIYFEEGQNFKNQLRAVAAGAAVQYTAGSSMWPQAAWSITFLTYGSIISLQILRPKLEHKTGNNYIDQLNWCKCT